VKKEEEGDWKGFYTDAPELRRGYVRPFLQILGWIFFHPSAWRSYVASIDPALDPALRLIELTRPHLAHRRFRRLLVVLVLVPAMVWIGLARAAYSGVARVLGVPFAENVISNIFQLSTEFALAWLFFGLAAAAPRVLGKVLMWEMVYFVGSRSGLMSVPIGALSNDDSIATGFGLGICLAITGATGHQPSRIAWGRLFGGATLGLLMAAAFRGALELPRLYLFRHQGGATVRGVAVGLIAAILFGIAARGSWSSLRAIAAALALGGATGVAAGLLTTNAYAGTVLFVLHTDISIGIAFLVGMRLGELPAGVLGAALAAALSWTSEVAASRPSASTHWRPAEPRERAERSGAVCGAVR
jgi:hypothetical protein